MCVCVCVSVCISAIEIQTTGPIAMKFGMGMLLNMGKVHSWVATLYPDPRWALNRLGLPLQPQHFDLAKTL